MVAKWRRRRHCGRGSTGWRATTWPTWWPRAAQASTWWAPWASASSIGCSIPGCSSARSRKPAPRHSTTGGMWAAGAAVRSFEMSEERQVDVAVVGGGPAGMAAALAAARAGASVALIDEYAAPGGQIWRRRYDEVGEAAPRSLPRAPRELCAALAGSSVRVLAGASVWAAPA